MRARAVSEVTLLPSLHAIGHHHSAGGTPSALYGANVTPGWSSARQTDREGPAGPIRLTDRGMHRNGMHVGVLRITHHNHTTRTRTHPDPPSHLFSLPDSVARLAVSAREAYLYDDRALAMYACQLSSSTPAGCQMVVRGHAPSTSDFGPTNTGNSMQARQLGRRQLVQFGRRSAAGSPTVDCAA